LPRPGELHPFREIRAGARHAVSTPGDLLFHIRAKRMDLCFELATQVMARIGNAVSPVDEVQGFRYFDDRDLMGFVDGTENPRGAAVADAVLVGDEEPDFAAGSCVIVQKYLHDLDAWNALSTEAQERIIGRTKHVKRLVKDQIIWAPAIAGAFVLTTRGGDFDLHIGQDVSIGYLSHTDAAVRLYLQETFTFLLLTNEAAVALAPPAKAKKA
jgi:Dyp-type peroxidase family